MGRADGGSESGPSEPSVPGLGWGGLGQLPFSHILEERPLLSKGSELIQFIYFEKDTKV